MIEAALSRLPRPQMVAMIVLFIGALAAGWLMLPGDAERIAMLERDGKDREAMALLEQRYASGDRRQRILFELNHFYEQFGDLAKARQMLELLGSARPNDASIQRQLAYFYKQTQDEGAYVKALARQIDLKYSEQACRELVGMLRLDGRYGDEQAMLVKCRQKGYRRTEDIVRLAQLLATDGDVVQASQLLRSVDDLKRLKTDRERLQLFSILLEAEQPRDALRRAVRWVKAGKEDTLPLTIIEMLVRSERHDLAVELARDISVPGDSVSLAVAEIMLDKSQTDAAQTYLRGWVEKARLTDTNIATRCIDAALDAEAPMMAYRVARKFGFQRLAESQLVALGEALAAISAKSEVEDIRTAISPEALASSPLLGAAVQLDQGSPAATTDLLTKVEPDSLEDWRLALWARLMTATGQSATADATLQRLGVRDAKTPHDTATPPAVRAATMIKRQRKVSKLRFKFNRNGMVTHRPPAAKAPLPFPGLIQ
jgi:hypothetical protein